jgi:hypothetical protein
MFREKECENSCMLAIVSMCVTTEREDIFEESSNSSCLDFEPVDQYSFEFLVFNSLSQERSFAERFQIDKLAQMMSQSRAQTKSDDSQI